jgi:hypothetical protein
LFTASSRIETTVLDCEFRYGTHQVIDTFMCLHFLTDLSVKYCYIDNIMSFPSSLISLDIAFTRGGDPFMSEFTLKNLGTAENRCAFHNLNFAGA